MLAALKRATVLVKAKFHPSDVTGSGFLFDKQGGDGFITTNAHVVAPGQADPKIEIVFDSGLSSERTVSGQLVAKDEQADLAIVKVTLADLPAPVAISRPVECYETMPILMLGFPFGGALARTRRNPEITVSEGRISSLRNDRHGRLAAIQIDGSINPGNSGGPVVNHSGELIGIAVAKVRGTQIGFVIPAAELREMLLGRIVQATAQQVEAANAQATFKISVDVADPGRHVKNVAVWTIRADQAKDDPQPNKDHWFGRLSDRMQKHSLERGEGRAFGFFRLPLDPAAAVDTHYRYQLSFERDDGSERFSEPVNLVAKTVANPQKAEFPPRRPPDPAPSVPTGPGIPGNLISAMMRAGDAITSPATRVPPREHQPRFPFPKPKATAAGSRRLVSQPISGAEGATATALPVRASRPDDPLVSQRTTAAWSADGDSVFILDADNVLWRFGIANGNVIEQARLSVEAECQDMALSQEGLVIALSSASNVGRQSDNAGGDSRDSGC